MVTVPDEIAEKIFDAFYNGGVSGERCVNGVNFHDVYQHNACNYTFGGSLEVDGKEMCFVCDDGDWGGSVIREYGSSDDVSGYFKVEQPERRAFVPENDYLKDEAPTTWQLYLHWRKEAWLVEMEGKYNYDRHFAPGTKTETHYREWAAKYGLKPGLLSSIGLKEKE